MNINDRLEQKGWELRGEYRICDKLVFMIDKDGNHELDCDYLLEDTFSEYYKVTLYLHKQSILIPIKQWESNEENIIFIGTFDSYGDIIGVTEVTGSIEDVVPMAQEWVLQNA